MRARIAFRARAASCGHTINIKSVARHCQRHPQVGVANRQIIKIDRSAPHRAIRQRPVSVPSLRQVSTASLRDSPSGRRNAPSPGAVSNFEQRFQEAQHSREALWQLWSQYDAPESALSVSQIARIVASHRRCKEGPHQALNVYLSALFQVYKRDLKKSTAQTAGLIATVVASFPRGQRRQYMHMIRFIIEQDSSVRKPTDYTPRDISKLVAALARIGADERMDVCSSALFAVLEKATIACVHDFELYSLIAASYGFAWAHSQSSASRRPEQLFAAICAATRPHVQTLDGKQISLVLWSFATVHQVETPEVGVLFDEIGATLVHGQKANKLNHKDLTQILWSFAKVQPSRQDVFEALSSRTVALLPEFTGRGLPPVLNTYATTCNADIALKVLSPAAGRVKELAPELQPHGYSQIAKAYALVPVDKTLQDSVFADLARGAIRCVSQFGPQECSNLLWGFAKADQKAPALFDAVANRLLQVLPNCTPQGLSNSAWALAVTKHHAVPVLEAIAARSVETMPQFNSQGLSNILWAFASLDVFNVSLFDAGVRRASATVSSANVVEVAMLLWAVSRYHLRGEHVVEEKHRYGPATPQRLGTSMTLLFDRACQRLLNADWDAVDTGSVQMLTWSLGKMGLGRGSYDGQIVEKLQASVERNLHAHGSAELCMTLWALARMMRYSPSLFERTAQLLVEERGCDDLGPAEVVMLLGAYHKAQQTPVELMRVLDNRITSTVDTFDDRHASAVLFYYAVAAVEAPVMFSALCEQVLALEALEARYAAQIMWSIVVNDHLVQADAARRCLVACWRCVEQDYRRTGAQAGVVRLAQMLMTARVVRMLGDEALLQEMPGISEVTESVAGGDLCQLERDLQGTSRTENIVSLRQRAISDLLQSRWEHQLELEVLPGMVVDMGNVQSKTVVEFDGPSHFVNNGNEYVGNSTLKTWMLQKMGWQVVRISYMDWNAVEKASEETQLQFLESCIPWLSEAPKQL